MKQSNVGGQRFLVGTTLFTDIVLHGQYFRQRSDKREAEANLDFEDIFKIPDELPTTQKLAV